MTGEQIRVVDTITYLGIKWKEGIGCQEHIIDQMKKVKTTFLSIVALTRTTSGLECTALKTLYEGVAVPLMTYGCEIWGDTALRMQQLRRKLLQTQRSILLMINKPYRIVSHEANLC